MHLAATLKKLLTILLLIAIGVQTSGYFDAKPYSITFAHEADDKCGATDEKKGEKEYDSCTSFIKTQPFIDKSYIYYACNPGLAPLLAYVTPPPDVTL